MNFAASPETVWKGLMFFEQIGKPPPLMLRFFLPSPVGMQGRKSEIGDIIKCRYLKGHLLKQVTQINRRRTYAFIVIEQNLRVGRGMKLLGGSYTLRELPEARTEVALKTQYASPHRPRWFWKRVEAVVCHSFHRYILSAMHHHLQMS